MEKIASMQQKNVALAMTTRQYQFGRALVRYAVGFVLVAGLGWVAWSGLSAYHNQPKDDWRSAAQLIAGAIWVGDTIRVTQPTLPTYLLYYAPGLSGYVKENP